MKQPIAIFSNDWHLKKENKDEIKSLVGEKISYAKKSGIKYVIVLGDIFDSRIAQREDILAIFSEIADMVADSGLELWVIPGNHDKTDYSSDSSFLTPYKGRAGVRVINLAGGIPFPEHKIKIALLPFWTEEVWLERLRKLEEHNGYESDWKHILGTHIAVTGSVNNDGTHVSSTISPKMFKNYFKVFSGHYHNQQKIGSNFYHLPSIQQNNFGEDNEKGFTVLYSDGSHELVKSTFKKYHKVTVNLDEVTQDELNDLKRRYAKSKDNVRFELIGSENVLKAIKKEDFTSLGIDIKTKVKEIMDDIVYSETAEVIEHTKDSIADEFVKFCEKENLNYEQGIKYLKKKLKV